MFQTGFRGEESSVRSALASLLLRSTPTVILIGIQTSSRVLLTKPEVVVSLLR